MDAETLSLSDGCNIAIFIHSFIKEILERITDTEIVVYTDNLSADEATHSTKQLLEKKD